MDASPDEVTRGGVDESVAGERGEACKSGRANPDMVVTAFTRAGMTRMQRRIVADDELGRGEFAAQPFVKQLHAGSIGRVGHG